MNVVIIILFSLLFSTITSYIIMKKKNHKLISMLTAFIVNAVILIGAIGILENMNQEANLFGVGITNLYLLMFAIPVNTWINFLCIIASQKLIKK